MFVVYKQEFWQMIKKYSVLIGTIISMIFLLIAIIIYPGGTYQNKNSIGFDWTENYLCNLFETKALNGEQNTSLIWAYIGMFFYSISCGIFFVNMSKKIPEKVSANIIKYTGILTMPFTFMIVTPFHDLMLTISNILFWTCITWITVFMFRTRHHYLKLYCILCILIFYYAVYIHTSNNWTLLPIVAKVNTISTILLILGLEYYTKAGDFTHTKAKK